MRASVASRCSAAASVSSFLQKQNRTFCRPPVRRDRSCCPARSRRRSSVTRCRANATSSGKPKAADVRHDVVRAARREADEAGVARECRSSRSRRRAVVRGEIRGSSSAGSAQRGGRGRLQRRGGADGQEVVHLADRARDVRRRDRPADAPAGDAERLRQAVDRDRAIGHAVERRHRHVHGAVVEDVLVDLVGDRDRAPLLAQPRDLSSSSRVNTLPVGLFGVLMMIARVRLRERRGQLVRSRTSSRRSRARSADAAARTAASRPTGSRPARSSRRTARRR